VGVRPDAGAGTPCQGRVGARFFLPRLPRAGDTRFSWPLALLLFVAFTGDFAAYLGALWLTGRWQPLAGLTPWQIALLLAVVPLSAGVCKELLWHGSLIDRLEAGGRTHRRAVALAALSFALIHGVFLPDRLLVTFLLGLVGGWYHTQARVLWPLVLTRTVMNLWIFGLFLLLP